MRHSLTVRGSPRLRQGSLTSFIPHLQEGDALKITQHSQSIYLTYREGEPNEVKTARIDTQYLRLNGMESGGECVVEKVVLRKVPQLKVRVSELDYKIVSDRQRLLAEEFLGQVRVVWRNGKIPLYYSESSFITLSIQLEREEAGSLDVNTLVQFIVEQDGVDKQKQAEDEEERPSKILVLQGPMSGPVEGYENQVWISLPDFKQIFPEAPEAQPHLWTVTNRLQFNNCPTIEQFTAYNKSKKDQEKDKKVIQQGPAISLLVVASCEVAKGAFRCSEEGRRLMNLCERVEINGRREADPAPTIVSLSLAILLKSPHSQMQVIPIAHLIHSQQQSEVQTKDAKERGNALKLSLVEHILKSFEENKHFLLWKDHLPFWIHGQMHLITLTSNEPMKDTIKVVNDLLPHQQKDISPMLMQKISTTPAADPALHLSYKNIQKWIGLYNSHPLQIRRRQSAEDDTSAWEDHLLQLFQSIYSGEIGAVMKFIGREMHSEPGCKFCVVCSFANNGKSLLEKALGRRGERVWCVDLKYLNDPSLNFKDISCYLEYVFACSPYSTIFLDNLDSICYRVDSGDLHRKRERVVGKLILRKIQSLSNLFSKKCIATAKSEGSLDEEMESSCVVHLKNPSREEREKALASLLPFFQNRQILQSRMGSEEDERVRGSGDRDKKDLIRQIVDSTESLSFGLFSKCALLRKCYPKKAEGRRSEDFSSLAGMRQAKQTIRDIISKPLAYASIYKSLPIKLPRGVLLYGATGNGKSALGTALEHEFGMKYFSVKGSDILSKYIGGSEAAVRDIFEKALSVSPSIVFFDEFESIVPRRNSNGTGVNDRIVNQFLCYLDGVSSMAGVFIVAASSRPDLIDPAILRPGRLDSHLYLEYPGEEERRELVEMFRSTVSIRKDDEAVVGMTEHFSYSDMIGLFKELRIKKSSLLLKGSGHSVEEFKTIEESLFDETFERFKISVDLEEQKRQTQIYESFQSGRAPNIQRQRQILL